MATGNGYWAFPENTAMIHLGIVGISDGNGHPFSFSAIINGFSDTGMAASGWPVIHDYLRSRDISDFGFPNCRVTHAWTQDWQVTQKLCEACLIPHAVMIPADMIGKVDAVVLARDDYENHLRLALPFLEAGKHVFIDKPLSLDVEELRVFRPYLESGKLTSCAGMRYARELDEPRTRFAEYGEIRLIRGAILNCWEKYGIHMVDAILNIVHSSPVVVTPLSAKHTSLAVHMDDSSLLQIDALGDITPCFRVDIFGTDKVSSHEITDNFSMFRRLLWHFVKSIETDVPSIDPLQTLVSMQLLIAGRMAIAENRRVFLDETLL